MKTQEIALQIIVRTLSSQSTRGRLELGPLRLPCALGQGGKHMRKREGDGASPVGTWHLCRVLYRADRLSKPKTALPIAAMDPSDGWCDDPRDRNYNRLVNHPYPASAERLWREDHAYDLVIVTNHNTRPRRRNRGSAIFIHAASPNFEPTQGCIALRLDHLQRLVTHVRPGTQIKI